MNPVFWQLHYHSTDVSFLLRRRKKKFSRVVFPLFTSRHMEVVNTATGVMMQNYENCWKGRKTTVFTLMDEHVEVHGFLYSVRFNDVKFDVKKTPSLWSLKVCPENPWNQIILGSSLLSSTVTLDGLFFSQVPHRGRLYLPLLSRVHSCSSSSSWSSSMASIWVLEHTSLIGAESSPSTTSSLDISLFFCRQWKPHNARRTQKKRRARAAKKLKLRPLLR